MKVLSLWYVERLTTFKGQLPCFKQITWLVKALVVTKHSTVPWGNVASVWLLLTPCAGRYTHKYIQVNMYIYFNKFNNSFLWYSFLLLTLNHIPERHTGSTVIRWKVPVRTIIFLLQHIMVWHVTPAILNQLRYFHMTEGLPPDCLHDMLESTLAKELLMSLTNQGLIALGI